MAACPSVQRFRAVRLSDNLQKEFRLPELICADPNGLPFPIGQAFHAWLLQENACQITTANAYLQVVLQFLTYLWCRSPAVLYAAPATQIRTGLREYLQAKKGCAIRPHRNGNYLVTPRQTCSPETVRLCLVVLRRFYEFAILKGWYTDANPLVWPQRLTPLRQGFTPQIPPLSGLTLPSDKRGRLPDTYFCVVADDWQPAIIDDPDLPRCLIAACTNLRDQVIIRMLFESGARISEVLSLTVDDWRQGGLRERAHAINKGSQGRRVKELWWSDTTACLLHRYFSEDRMRCDPFKRGLESLSGAEPIFITEHGRPYHYAAFYFHWQRTCQTAKVQLHPHQARHWFVTMALRKIESVQDERQRATYRQGLIAYMHWKNPETIRAYDHHLRLVSFDTTHQAILRLLQDDANQATPSLQSLSRKPLIPDAISPEMWTRLCQVLDESGAQP